MKIGAHVSIAGGFDKSVDRGEELGCTVIQTFASSPRTMKFNPYNDDVLELYQSKKQASQISDHVFHGVYLINLAHESSEYVEVCTNSLIFYQQLAGQIGGMGTIFHIGSHKGKGLEAVIGQVAEGIVQVLAETPDGVRLMLENAAGHAGTIGVTFDELAQITEAVVKRGGDETKLAFCLDTQHGYASGNDLTNQEGIDRWLESFDQKLGLDKLAVFHVNDSATPLGSNRDRHANIGEGEIGDKGFSLLLKDPRLIEVPFVLEVPGKNKSGPGKEDVAHLLDLAG